MELSEKELEDYIYFDIVENGGSNLFDRGIEFGALLQPNRVIWKRQLNIDPYGICDIVGFYRQNGCIHVELIEIKKVNISPDHFEQIFRYKKGLEVYLKNTFNQKCQIKFKLSLIGIYDGLYIQNYTDIDVYGFRYDLGGISFDRTEGYSGWYIKSGKDKSFRNGKKIH